MTIQPCVDWIRAPQRVIRILGAGWTEVDTGMECQQTQVAALGRVRTRWTGFLFFGLAAQRISTIEHSCGFGKSQLNHSSY